MKTKHIATIVLSMLLIYAISFGIDAQAGDGVNECPSCCFCMNDGTSENLVKSPAVPDENYV